MVGMSVPLSAQAANGEQLRLLHVHAHPDDESSKGAATSAKYVAEGVRVVVATCTGGERGSVLNPQMDRPEVWENMAEVRQAEMARAREILGVEHYSLGFIDSGLPEGDPVPELPEGSFASLNPTEAAEPLVEVIRMVRPQVLTTYDEQGGYPHPDHIQCHRVSVEALRLAADSSYRPDLGEPWSVLKVYYQMGFHRLRYAALDEALHEHGMDSPYSERLANWEDLHYERRITTRVPCAEYFQVRDAPARPRLPDRPERHLVLGAAGDPGQGVADRGLATGLQRGAHGDPRGRPVLGITAHRAGRDRPVRPVGHLADWPPLSSPGWNR